MNQNQINLQMVQRMKKSDDLEGLTYLAGISLAILISMGCPVPPRMMEKLTALVDKWANEQPINH